MNGKVFLSQGSLGAQLPDTACVAEPVGEYLKYYICNYNETKRNIILLLNTNINIIHHEISNIHKAIIKELSILLIIQWCGWSVASCMVGHASNR